MVEMVILCAVDGVQKEMIVTVWWLSFFIKVGGGESTLYTWKGA